MHTSNFIQDHAEFNTRQRRFGVSGEHIDILNELLRSHDVPANIKEAIVNTLYEHKRKMTFERRRMGASGEHFMTLLNLKETVDSEISYKLKYEIDEAVYDLEARSKSQKRRKALAY